MAINGWYPDPDGTPNRYRYWNGTTWSTETSFDPSAPAPGRTPGSTATKINNRWSFLIIGLVIVVIIAVIGFLVVRSSRPEVLIDPNPPAPTVSGWDDSSPYATANPTPQGWAACADGDPYAAEQHPADGRIHGGSLSITQPGGDWVRADDYAQMMTWAYDVAGAREQIEPHWWAMVAVGALYADDGFTAAKQSAYALMQCIASSGYYRHFTGRTDDFSKPFSLDGADGWVMRSQVRVDDPQVQAAGDVVEVVVLDTGTPGQLSFFAGFVPIGDHDRLRILDDTVDGMRLE